MYYNTLLSIPLLALYMLTDPARHVAPVLAFAHWSDPMFIFFFTLSALLGFAINWATYWCTHVNSALTTTVVGCLKNILSTYVGMVLGGDYIYSLANFMGLNVSVLGSVVYAVVKYREEATPRAALPAPVLSGGISGGLGGGGEDDSPGLGSSRSDSRAALA
jgi:solute carrier family 35